MPKVENDAQQTVPPREPVDVNRIYWPREQPSPDYVSEMAHRVHSMASGLRDMALASEDLACDAIDLGSVVRVLDVLVDQSGKLSAILVAGDYASKRQWLDTVRVYD